MVTLRKKDLKKISRLVKKSNLDYEHSLCVAELSMMIFDALKKFHKLSKSERKILYAAALLHDIGWGISGAPHNKSGMKFILADKTLPLSSDERRVVALIVRYHRGSIPKKSHKHFSTLNKSDRNVVCMLAGVLRVADGLDSSHSSMVKLVVAEVTSGKICFIYQAEKHLEGEEMRALKKSDLLESVLGRDVGFRWEKK